MKFYKICKYDYSNENYKDEWTSVKKIKNFKMAKEYIKIEKQYIKAVLNFFSTYKKLILEDFEIYQKNDFIMKICNKYKNNHLLQENTRDLIYISKLFLREKIWCKLVTNKTNNSYICFGNDYYLLIGIDDNISIEDIMFGTNLYYYDWYDVFE